MISLGKDRLNTVFEPGSFLQKGTNQMNGNDFVIPQQRQKGVEEGNPSADSDGGINERFRDPHETIRVGIFGFLSPTGHGSDKESNDLFPPVSESDKRPDNGDI